jgi:hypothetical protein
MHHSLRRCATIGAALALLVGVLAGQTAADASTPFRSPTTAGRPIGTNRRGVTPLDHSGCSSSVCIAVQSYNGHGSDILEAQVTSKGDLCLPVGSQVYLLYGSSVSSSTVWKVGTINTQYTCEYGWNFPIYQNLNNKWWLCGELSALPGKPCAQILS